MTKVRIVILSHLTDAATTNNEVTRLNHINFVRHLIFLYHDTSTRINADEAYSNWIEQRTMS